MGQIPSTMPGARAAAPPGLDGQNMGARARPGDLEIARLLDLEPELGYGIDQDDWAAARLATHAQLLRLPSGQCDLRSAVATADVVALVVNEGMISREVALGHHVAFELLGPGDVLLPSVTAEDDGDGVGGQVVLSALSATRLVVLDSRFAHAAARWPVLMANLHCRVEGARRRFAMQGLAAHLPRAEDRVLLTLWLLADSCGRVTPQGIVIPLSLSHEVLARLTAARRPTVTLALGSLKGAGCIRSNGEDQLTLTAEAQRRIEELTSAGNEAPPLGPHITLSMPALGRTATARTVRTRRPAA